MNGNYHYDIPNCEVYLKDPLLTLRSGAQRLDIFLLFFDRTFLQQVWDSHPLDTWIYRNSGGKVGNKTKDRVLKQKTINSGRFSLKILYGYLTICIYIAGNCHTTEQTKSNRPIRTAIEKAKTYFATKYPGIKTIGIEICELLISRFRITADMFALLSKNFQSIIERLGEYVAGDEKLFHFTGNSGDIRLVPSKPDHTIQT